MEQSKKHLDDFASCLKRVTDSYSGVQIGSVEYFCLGLLERLMNSIIGLSVLLPEYEKDERLEYPIGITLRSVLLDILIGMNMYNLLKELKQKSVGREMINDELTKYSNFFLADGIKQTIDYMAVLKDEGILTTNELHEGYKKIHSNFRPFFEEGYLNNGDKPTLFNKEKISPLKLFRKIMNVPEFRALGNIYDVYNFFSKYDHFGIMYFEFTRQSKGEKDNRIRGCVDQFSFHIYVLLTIMIESSSEKNNVLIQERAFIGRKMKEIIKANSV